MEEKYILDDYGRRLRNTELVIPVCVGTVAFWLGKKASEYSSHRWTVYLRGPHNEDLSYIISKVTFELHHTFNNPQRTIQAQPFEVTEHGWGEFDIGITIHFAPDAHEKEVQFFHRLRLYEEDGSPQNPKKPVVVESYEELVFSEPYEDFYNRVAHFRPGPSYPPPSQVTWLPQQHSEAQELEHIKMCRMKIAHMVLELRRDFDLAPK